MNIKVEPSWKRWQRENREHLNVKQREWRRKNKDRVNAENREKRMRNIDHYRKQWREWRARNQEKQRKHKNAYRAAHKAEFNRRQREYYQRIKGPPESEMLPKLTKEFCDIHFFKNGIPDAYDFGTKVFLEVKRANTERSNHWRKESEHFPNLFFAEVKDDKTVDQQIQRYPKPLLVIIYHYRTGEELTRRLFT